MRLIDADALPSVVGTQAELPGLIVKAIQDAPTIDAVPVVRCKDCRWGKEVSGNVECLVNDYAELMYHGYYWYCANGERKDSDV